MENLNREQQVTFLFSTHDPRVMARARRLVRLVDGRIEERRRPRLRYLDRIRYQMTVMGKSAVGEPHSANAQTCSAMTSNSIRYSPGVSMVGSTTSSVT